MHILNIQICRLHTSFKIGKALKKKNNDDEHGYG